MENRETPSSELEKTASEKTRVTGTDNRIGASMAAKGKGDFESEIDLEVEGTVVQVDPGKDDAAGDFGDVYVDIGRKSDGRIPRTDFREKPELNSRVAAVIKRMPIPGDDMILLSKKEADERRSWNHIREAFENNVPIEGRIVARQEKGYTVDIEGKEVFMPATHVGHRDKNNKAPLEGQISYFKVLEIKHKFKSALVSRKQYQEEISQKNWGEFTARYHQDDVVRAVVSKIVSYGVFLELDGLQGLLHFTDISWRKGRSFAKMFQKGQEVELKILSIDEQNQRVNFGLKQMTEDPWVVAQRELQPGQVVRGIISSVTRFGAFLEVEGYEGIEGLIHKSEMSWSRRAVQPNQVLQPGETAEAQILDIDFEKRKLALGLKQVLPNPWDNIGDIVQVGDEREGVITSITKFGAFVKIVEDVEGLIHISDLSWDENIKDPKKILKKGQTVNYKVLDINHQEHRISCGLKQLQENPYIALAKKYPKNTTVDGVITSIAPFGVFVRIDDRFEGLAHISTLSENRIENADEIKNMFQVGDKIGVVILRIEPETRKISLSIKAFNRAKEKKEIEQYISDGAPASYNAFGDLANKFKKK